MKKMWQCGAFFLLALMLALVMMLPSTRQTALGATGDEGKSTGGPHYSVVMTEGHNLLVTDNAANKLFFYTIDKDKPIGSPLKLRASVELSKVGQEEINITPHNVEKEDK